MNRGRKGASEYPVAGTIVQAKALDDGTTLVWVDCGCEVGVRKLHPAALPLYTSGELLGMQVVVEPAGAIAKGGGSVFRLVTIPREDGKSVLVMPHMYVPDGSEIM